MTTGVGAENEPVVPPPGEAPPRVEALRDAAKLINGSRAQQYGGPIENFTRIATIWSVILGVSLTAEDVAMCMAGVKMARYASGSGFQADTWVDLAGYAGCGFEVGQALMHENVRAAAAAAAAATTTQYMYPAGGEDAAPAQG